MDLAKIKVVLDCNGFGTVEINGVKIEGIRATEIKAVACETPIVTLSLIGELEYEGEAKILIEKFSHKEN